MVYIESLHFILILPGMKYPFWIIAAAYVAGITTAMCIGNCPVPSECLYVLLALLFLTAIVLYLCRWHRLLSVSIHLLVFACGMTLTFITPQPNRHEHRGMEDDGLASRAQEYLHARCAEADFGAPQRSVIEAMTLGRRTELTKETRQLFARAGVSHVLALSGMHISTIFIFLQYLLGYRIMNVGWQRRLNIIIALLLWAYTYIAGMPPSLVRAVTMCTFMAIGSVIERSIVSINSLVLSAIAMLLVNPRLIADIGFQLSYLSVVGIIVLGVPLCRLCPIERFAIARWTWYSVCISLVCWAFTAPLVTYTFGELSTIGIACNLCITLLASALIFTNCLWMLTAWLAPVAVLLNWIATIMLSMVEWFASLPFASVAYRPTLLQALLMYVVVACLTVLVRMNTRK